MLMLWNLWVQELLVDGDNNTGTDGTATLTDSETQTDFDCDGGDQLNVHVDVVAGHAHLNSFGKGDDAGNVGGTEVELGTVVVKEGGVTAALVLGQNVDLALELGVGVDGLGSSQNLTTLNSLLVDTTEQAANVVASLSVLQGLVEHFGAGNGGLGALVLQANDLDLVANLDGATLNTAGNNSAAARDGEHVLDGHQEGQIGLAVGSGDPAVNSVHQLLDAGILRSIGVIGLADQSVQSAAADDGGVVAREAVEVKQLADFHLDELEELFIVDLVALVQEDQNGRNVNLTGQQQVLAGLSHGAVGSSDNQDSAVHLSSTGDHVLDIVGVARAVDVGVVTDLDLAVFAGLVVVTQTVIGLVLDVSGVDGDTTLSLFGSLIDVCIINEVSLTLRCECLCNSCC